MTITEGRSWTVTATDVNCPGQMRYSMTDGETTLTLLGPVENMQIKVMDDYHTDTRSLYEWNLLIQRMVTLLEVARSCQRGEQGIEVDINVTPADTLCITCWTPPLSYKAWGSPCERLWCEGTYYPRSFVEKSSDDA